MPSSAFTKFESFVTAKAAGTHANALNADTDTLKVYLTNATPSVSADLLKADLAEISAGNGYTAGGADTLNAATTTAGVITVAGTDVTWTASGGSIGPFRYVVLYNDTPANDPLIGYWDYGSAVTVGSGENFTHDFGSSMFTDN
jgi:hypothetical protein